MNNVKPNKFEALAREKLQGRMIQEVRYLTDEEVENLGFYSKTLIIFLDNGHWFLPMADDEGNDVGALLGGFGPPECTVLPVMR